MMKYWNKLLKGFMKNYQENNKLMDWICGKTWWVAKLITYLITIYSYKLIIKI